MYFLNVGVVEIKGFSAILSTLKSINITLNSNYQPVGWQPPEVFCKKCCFNNFAIFTWKHLCWRLESFFNKAAGFQACNFIKKRLQHRCFAVNIAKFLGTPFLKNIYQRLLGLFAFKTKTMLNNELNKNFELVFFRG